MAHAIRIYEHGGPEKLKWEEVEVGDPGPGQVRVRNTAVGLNFIDTYQRSGLYPMQLPFILGSEGAGVVEAVGPKVRYLKPGDRVAYSGPLGAYLVRHGLLERSDGERRYRARQTTGYGRNGLMDVAVQVIVGLEATQEPGDGFEASMRDTLPIVHATRRSMRDKHVEPPSTSETVEQHAGNHAANLQGDLPFGELLTTLLRVLGRTRQTAQNQAAGPILDDPCVQIDAPHRIVRFSSLGVLRPLFHVIAENEIDRFVERVCQKLQISGRQVTTPDHHLHVFHA